MASNKKAQILAAVMCASSIFGSYTVVSAADTPTKIESTDKSSSVTANNNNQIKATAGVSGSQQSTITLGDKSLSIDVGKQKVDGKYTYGTFTLNSSNLAVSGSTLTMKSTSNSYTAALANTGLTIKNGTTTLASLNNSGLIVNGTSNINSTGTGANSGKSAKSEVNYNSGVKDTVTNDTIKGYTTTAQVLYSGVNNKVVDNNTNNILAQTSVGLVDRPQDNSKYGNIVLTANKYVVDTTEAVTKKVSTTILTLDGNTAKLEAGVGGSNNANVNLNSDKKGTVAITAGKVEDVQGNITLSGKNVNLDGNGLTLYKDNAEGTKTQYAALNSSGLSINNNANFDRFGTNSYNTTFKATNSEQSYNLEKWTAGNLENKVSSTLNASGLTTTVQSKGNDAGIENTNSTKNKTTSAVAYNSVTDTVYDANGKKTSYSNVGTTSITDTVYANNGSSTLASSTLKKSTAINEDVTTESGSVELTANKITTNGEETTTLTSKLNLTGDSASLTSGSASVKVDNATGNVAITANQKGSQGYVTLSGKNVNLDGNGLTLYKDNAEGTKTQYAALNSSGLSINNNANFDRFGTNSYNTTFKATNSEQSYNLEKWTAGNLENKVSSTLNASGLTTTVQSKGNDAGIENTNSTKNKTTSQVSATGVRDNVYDDSGNIKSTSVVDTNGVTLTSNRYDTGSKISSSLTIKGDSATLASGSASVTLNNTTGNVAITANQKGSQGYVTLSGKNVKLDSNGLNIYDGTNTTPTATISKTGAITGTGLTVNNSNGTKSTLNSSGLIVNGTGISSIKSTNSTTEAYVKNEITSGAMTTTARGGMYPSDADNKNKTTSQVSATGVRDTVYDDGGQIKATSSVTIGGIANTVNNSSITNTVNDVNTGKPLADSRLTTSGISNTTTALQMTGTNAGNTMSTGIYQNNGGISATATKKDVDGNTIGTSTLSLGGNSASLKVGNYGFAVDSSNNVSITGNNATLSGSTFTLKDANGKTATLNTSGLTLKDEDGNTTGGISTTGAVTGTSLSIKAPIDPIKPNNDYVESKVTTSGVADTIKQGGFTRATSNVTINSIKDTIYTNDGKELSSSNISKSVSDATESGSVTLIANKITTNDDATTTTLTSKLNLTGDSATLTSGSAYVKADNTTGNVLFSGKNVSLSGSTFTLKDTTNGKTLASLGASGLSINNADGIKVGGISNTGYLMANDGMNVTDKNSSWVTIGTSTMQKDITATTTTSYAGITNKIDTTLAGNKTYTSGTVVGPTSVTTTVQGSNTTDAISGNKNKTTSTVSATGVTDTVYNVKGNQVASSSVTTNGIVNTTTNLSIDGSTNNTMSTSIYQDKRGISASATKKDENGTVGTSTLTLAGNSASLRVGSYGFTVDSNNVLINGKNARLDTNGLSLNKVNSDGTTTNYGTWNSNGLNVNGTGTTTIKSTNATTGAMGQSQLSYNGVTDTVTNAAGNKTTSTVNATGVTDTVYNVKGNQVASSSVGTSGISNTTTALQMTGTNAGNTMSTGIYQNNGGISATATKKDVDGNTIGTSTLSLGGNSASLKVGNYGFAVDSSNNVSISGNNATLSGSTFTLKDVNTGKTAILNTNGLTLKDGDGTITGGISTTGAVTGTSLRITTSEDAGGNKTVSTVATNAVTDTVTNTKTNNKTTSQVSATGVRDTVYDANNKTVASSTVTTSGITNSTNISGIAIKDDKNNTKTMNTSIAQNANGVNISSTKYNVYNDGTNTVQTTDGISSISVNGAKTTISGYGYKYEKDENGNPILDEKGNPIRSSYTNASLSVDGESGIIGLSGKNVGLSANGLTLYKDVEGVKTQYASLTAGGLNVNGTGYTTIKSTNATTGAMGQSQVSYNGVTDTVTNAAGNKTTSTVNATGTIDQVYDTDGKTRIAYSNITTTGITDSFTKDGITNSVTTNANGTTFASTGNGSTTIKGGSITTNSITVAGNTIDGGFFDTIGETNSNTAGIVRTEINGDWITSIEGAINISRSGNISLNADKLTYSYNDGKNSGTLGALANKVDDIYDRTQGIDYDKATGTTTIDGNLSVKDETTTGGTAGSTGETGTTPINGNITANTANIGGVQMGNNTVTATTGNFENITVGGTEGTSINKDGVTVGDKKSDNYTSITNNDVVVNNNGNKTSLADVGNRVTGLESSVNSMNNRLSDVEDRIDKVGAMSAAIANLRTMGFDPEAPTEIAIGVGQYKSETGLALGVFHYPNQDFMLSASISTSGDEVMGGIGATWKLGRKSAAEKAKDEEARRLEKAEEIKKLAQDAKVKAQAERHAKLLAEREAQKTA